MARIEDPRERQGVILPRHARDIRPEARARLVLQSRHAEVRVPGAAELFGVPPGRVQGYGFGAEPVAPLVAVAVYQRDFDATVQHALEIADGAARRVAGAEEVGDRHGSCEGEVET